MVETSVWQSPGGAVASLTVTFDETPLTNLGTSDRNPGEMQPRASNTNPTIESPTLWRPVFEKWSAYIRERKAAGTHKEYTQKVRATFDWVEATRRRADLRDIMWEDFEAYRVSWNSGRRLKPNTENVWVAALESFYAHAIDRLELDRFGVRNVARKLERHSIEAVNRSKENRAPISKEDLQRVLALAEEESNLGWSLTARFLWTTISRLQDAWTLQWSMLDLSAKPKAVFVKPSKHGYNATKLLDAGLGRRLKDWKRLKDPQPEDFVFHHELVSEKAFLNRFNRAFKEYAARSDVRVRVSSHTLRKSANTHGLVRGLPEMFLKRQGVWAIASAWDSYCLEDMETWREKGLVELALD